MTKDIAALIQQMKQYAEHEIKYRDIGVGHQVMTWVTDLESVWAALPPSPQGWHLAEVIARAAHAGQKDTVTGADYITHIERVVALMLTDEEKAVAWLHDVIEDTTVTVDVLKKVGICPRVIAAVVTLTRHQQQPYERYIDDIIDSNDVLAQAVKLADLADHLRPNCPLRLRPRYVAALRALSSLPAPPVAGDPQDGSR